MVTEREGRSRVYGRIRDLLKTCDIEPERVQFLAKGYHHTVYTFSRGEGEKLQVVKVPRIFKAAGVVHSAKQEQSNADIVAKTFGQYSVPTIVLQSEKGYCVVMDAIEGAPLHANDTSVESQAYKPELREQLVHIIDSNKTLLRSTGYFLDLTGAHALFDELQRPFGKERKQELANLIVEENNGGGQTLRIIDNDLISIGRGNPLERFKSLVVFIANYQAIRRDFGMDIRPNKPTTRLRRPR